MAACRVTDTACVRSIIVWRSSRSRAGKASERAGQKIHLEGLLANLRMQRLAIDRRRLRALRRIAREHARGVADELLLPLRDLVRMDVEPGRQLGHRLIALQGG